MTKLPVIVGFGGYNSAGRSSFHHAYRRTVLDSLTTEKQTRTVLSLASLMKLVRFENGYYFDVDEQPMDAEQVAQKYRATIEQNTLLRRIGLQFFDVDNVASFKDVELISDNVSTFTMAARDVPNPLPANWQLQHLDDKTVKVTVAGQLSVKMESFRVLDVQAAGQLPTGFEPAQMYNSRFHPRGLQMAVLGASDAINSIGIDWQTIVDSVQPDQISVYATSAMGQNDENGNAGMMQARLKSSRITSKQLPLGLNSMPADFVNAYVCGNVGTTGSIAGACASFLYNLRLGVDDITSGKRRVAIVGASEAPIVPEIIEGYAAMSALATDERLSKLDDNDEIDHRRASRPFGDNCGFSLGESCQFFILMDDELAIELGADIYGSVNDVFVNADGFKKSISSPGAGNYITLAKAVASARSILGEEAVRERSFVQAHGSSTPQNRVTESMILDKVAQAFDIKNWTISAVKSYLGHPLASASGDQLASALGVFSDGIVPGIKTMDKVADDVLDDRLDIILQDKHAQMDVAFLNSKGFGGNNATASVLSANVTESMLDKRYGEQTMAVYRDKREQTRAKAQEYDDQACSGQLNVIYNFGTNIVDEQELHIDADKITLPNFASTVNLNLDNPYEDMI